MLRKSLKPRLKRAVINHHVKSTMPPSTSTPHTKAQVYNIKDLFIHEQYELGEH
jgi:hypothetical protein